MHIVTLVLNCEKTAAVAGQSSQPMDETKPLVQGDGGMAKLHQRIGFPRVFGPERHLMENIVHRLPTSPNSRRYNYCFGLGSTLTQIKGALWGDPWTRSVVGSKRRLVGN